MTRANSEDARDPPLPAFIAPCLATAVKTVPSGPNWVHEIKFDGYRIVARLENASVRLLTRNGHDWTARFPAIADELATFEVAQAMIDGEIVVRDAEGLSDFTALVSDLKTRRFERIEYMAFDVMHLNGQDVRPDPLSSRKQLLAALLDRQRHLDRVHCVDGLTGNGTDVFEAACALRLEGIVSKRLDRPYRSGRQSSWVKAKCQTNDDFTIVGYIPMNGSPNLVGALVVASEIDGRLHYAGRIGTGFSVKAAAALFERLSPLCLPKMPLDYLPSATDTTGVVWTRPQLVAHVTYREQLSNGSLRHAVFKSIREPE